MEVFRIELPRTTEVPIIVSSPHSGTAFPDNIPVKDVFKKRPDDTDWFIDQLYDFTPDLGITLISAVYNRWVIDLNRDPSNIPLYSDGRVITGLTPVTTFNGEELYEDQHEPEEDEIRLRLDNYYRPYHDQLSNLIQQKLNKFGVVVLFDAHSIRKFVPGIRPEPFPDLILGDDDGKTAAPRFVNATMKCLAESDYVSAHNNPFKGGYITRHYGNPENNIHALQLEMAKLNYMDDSETHYHSDRADHMREVLKNIFNRLIDEIQV